MTFPVEMYRDHFYRLAHGLEEFTQLIGEGWAEVKPAGHKYIPFSAAGVVVKAEPVSHGLAEALTVPDEVVEPVKRGVGRPPLVRPKGE